MFTMLAAIAALAVQDAPLSEASADAAAPVDTPANVLLEAAPDRRDVACPFRGRLEYEPDELSCGVIFVPENREAEQSRLIRLFYVHMPATGEAEERRDDPILYLTGGPGVPVEGYVERLRDHPVFETRDLYILEQRGIENSGAFCPLYDTLSPGLADPRSMAEMEIAGAERMALCFEEASANGVDLRGYSTVENARDVKALRQALGYDDWNIWGISYGSHLGQMVMRVDSEGVRAIVLDAIVPNDLGGGFGDTGRMAETILANYESACPAGAPCDGFADRMFEAIEAMQADPIIIPVEDAEVAPSGEVWLPPVALMLPAFMMSYEHEEHPAAPAVTDALSRMAVERDPDVIEGLGAALSEAGAGVAPFSVAQGMSAAIRCNDGYTHQTRSDQAASSHTRFEGVFYTSEGAQAAAAACEAAGLAPRDRTDYALPEAVMPTLIVNGAWDPVTPPWLAEYIHDGMPGSRLVIAPNAGHGPTRALPECAAQVMTDFFDNPDVENLDAACLEAGVDAPVYLDFVTYRAPERLIALLPGAPASFAAPGLAAGLSALVLVGGFGLILFGFLARLIDRHPASELAADTGGARLAAFATTVAALSGAALIGAGGYAAYELTPTALAAGLLAPAQIGVWLVFAAALLGIVTLGLLVRALGSGRVRFGTLVGFALIGLAGPVLAGLLVWAGLSPI